MEDSFMWRYALVVAVVACLFVPSLAQAQFKSGDWELTLSGVGNNDKDFRSGAANVNGSLGYFYTKELEVSARQGLFWGDGGSFWSGATNIGLDYHFDMEKWQPFVGGNMGYQYGDAVDDAWLAGPEAGVKYFLNPTTFIQFTITYEFKMCEGIDEGAFLYGLGLGVRL
jgi:hypothetical protein